MVIFHGILMVILMVIYGDFPWDFDGDLNGNLWWFSMGCNGIYPLVMVIEKKIANMVIEIVELHSKNADVPVREL